MRFQLFYAITVVAFATTASADTLTVASGTCFDGDCGPGSPPSGAGGIFPGATGIGSGATRHISDPLPGTTGPALNVFMSASATEDFGIFRGDASMNAFGDSFGALAGDGWAASAGGTDTETWTITGGTGTGHVTLSWTVTGSASPLTTADVGGVSSTNFFVNAEVNGFTESTGNVTKSGVYSFGDPLPFQFNVPFTIVFTNQVAASFNVTDGSKGIIGSATADFSDTSTLTGALITDAFGNPVPDAIITSDAGIRFPLTPPVESAVPEPGSLLSVLVGMGGLWIGARLFPAKRPR